MDIVPCPSCGQSSEYTPLWKILHHLRFPDRYFDLVRWNRWAEARAFLNVRIVENRGMVPRLLEMSRVRRLINCIEVLGKRASLVIRFSSMDTPRPEEVVNQGLLSLIPCRSEARPIVMENRSRSLHEGSVGLRQTVPRMRARFPCWRSLSLVCSMQTLIVFMARLWALELKGRRSSCLEHPDPLEPDWQSA